MTGRDLDSRLSAAPPASGSSSAMAGAMPGAMAGGRLGEETAALEEGLSARKGSRNGLESEESLGAGRRRGSRGEGEPHTPPQPPPRAGWEGGH